MGSDQVHAAPRAERKKELYILSLDNGRIFWVVAIGLLVLVFLFLLGYWIGHDTVPAGQADAARVAADDGLGQSRDVGTLKKELERLGSQQTASLDGAAEKGLAKTGPDEALAENARDDKAGVQRQGDAEKPKIDGEALTTKSEKKDFETLRGQKSTARKTAAKTSARTTVASKKTTGPARAAAPREAAGGRYLVQVASFGNRASADGLVRSLERKQYQVSVAESRVDGKEYYRVRVGGYDSFETAARTLATLRGSAEGRGSYIVQK